MFHLAISLDGVPMERHALRSGDTIVGRAPSCDVVIDDPSVSRQHARFRLLGESCIVTDLGSRNGVVVNGQLLPEAELQDGDTVVLGRAEVQLERSVDEVTLTDTDSGTVTGSTIFREAVPGRGGAATRNDRWLQLFGDIARTLIGTHAVGTVLDRVLDLTLANLAADRAVLVLRDARSGTLVPRAFKSRHAADAAEAQISRTVTDIVVGRRVSMLTPDVNAEPALHHAESLIRSRVGCLMCAPLWSGTDVIGVLYADAPAAHTFGPPDLDLLTAVANYAAVALEQARLATRVLDESRRRERLSRYHSPAVISRILDSGDIDAFIAQEKDLSVVFADIVGFTSLSEHLPPADLARLLNRIFGSLTEIIFEHDGTVDKFIGDAVLAIFGAPLDQPDHADRAVRAAREMRQDIQRLRREIPGGESLQLRFAINSGLAVVGDVGSNRRRDFTVLGDVVNIASRIESSVAQPGQIVIGQGTRERLRGLVTVRPLGVVKLRGRSAESEVFEVLDREVSA